MARIHEAEIERLKEAVPVARLVEASGIELKKGGKDLLGRCPFHEDATASLVVTPGKNLWHCFGCGVGGGPIDWVMKRQGVSFRHAAELLRADVGLAAGDGGAESGTRRRAKLPAPVALDAGEQELLNQVIGYYHETLLASPEALAYLERRGIASRELIEQHRLGFANRTLGLRLPATQIKAGAEVRGRLQKAVHHLCTSTAANSQQPAAKKETLATSDLARWQVLPACAPTRENARRSDPLAAGRRPSSFPHPPS